MGKISSSISKGILKILGWKLEGQYPVEVQKKMIIVAPHTSNWDFPLGLLVRSAIREKINFVGKDSLFKPPFGWIFRSLGGVPVDRSRSTNFVQAVVDIYNSREKFNLQIAPEGTRKRVEKFKSGFYYIAYLAKIPIQMIRFNFGEKKVEFRALFYPTGNYEEDIIIIEDYFRGIKGKNPEQSFY